MIRTLASIVLLTSCGTALAHPGHLHAEGFGAGFAHPFIGLDHLLAMLAVLPPGWGWSVCAFGPTEFACLTAAAALGGGVRIGFENNVHLPDGSPATDNAMQVSRMAQTLDALGIPRASWRQARERFFRR